MKPIKLKLNNKKIKLLGLCLILMISMGLFFLNSQINAASESVEYQSAFRNGNCRTFGTPQPTSIPGSQKESFENGNGVEANVNGVNSTIYKSNDIYHCCYEQLGNGEEPAACNDIPDDVERKITNEDRANPWYVNSNGTTHFDYGLLGQNISTNGYYANNESEAASSEFTYSTELDNFVVGGLSANDYLLYNYEARVTDPPPLSNFDDWYSYLRRLVPVNVDEFTTFGAANISGNISSGLPGTATEGVFIKDSGSLEINQGARCDGRFLIMVDGDITINPPFELTNRNINQGQGCIFIASGNIIVTDNGSGTERTIKAGLPPAEPLEAGMIAANKIIFEYNQGNSLFIRGFVSGKSGELMRDNDEANQPSIHTEYDPRYIELFQNELRLLRFSTREKGYTTPDL